jgi:hypothetical protein
MDKIEALFAALVKSSFRSRFNLSGKEANYLKEKGLEAVLEHARGFIEARLAPASPSNDGRQTPTKNHPVFIAQHATATCCRKCLEKWHNIPRGQPLTKEQVEYIISVLGHWLQRQKV